MHEQIWQFVRGDVTVAAFEQWLYAASELETAIGAERYLALISADFRNPEAVAHVRAELEAYVRSVTDMHCECVSLPMQAIIHMDVEMPALNTLREVARRGEPHWWLTSRSCIACGTPWLVAQEERHNDIFVLRRLTVADAELIVQAGVWPPYLSTFTELLQIGRDSGCRVRYVDPVALSLVWSAGDVAREHPGISVGELAPLLNLDLETAALVAERARQEFGSVISGPDES